MRTRPCRNKTHAPSPKSEQSNTLQMAGDNRTTTHRSRGRASPERTDADATREKSRRQGGRGSHHQRRLGGPIRWTFPVLGFISLLLIGSLVYYNWGFWESEGELVTRAKRSVTPLAMPKLMDLPQVSHGFDLDILFNFWTLHYQIRRCFKVLVLSTRARRDSWNRYGSVL